MIPLVCPSCRSLRISGGGRRFHCKECGKYLSQKSLSRQLHKRELLGYKRQRGQSEGTESIRVCGNEFSKHETHFR